MAQLQLRVRAESRIELRAEADGSLLLVQGTLRDERAHPLAGRFVRIEGHDTTGSVFVETRRTDRSGRFAARLPADVRTVEARFDGDEHHDPARATRSIDPARAEVSLEVAVPDEIVDLDRPHHEVTVRARSAAGAAALPITVLDEMGRVLAEGRTDAEGVMRVAVATRRLGPPGPGRIVARTNGDRRRAEAQTEVPVLRVLRSRLTLRANRRDDGTVALHGTLGTARGPSPSAPVGLWDGQRLIATVLTDAAGRYHFALPAPGDGETLEIEARHEGDPPGLLPSRSGVVRLGGPAYDEPTSAWRWTPTAIGALLGLLLGALAIRARRRMPSTRSSPSRTPGFELASRASRSAARRDVSIQALDGRDDEPLPEAI
ncbi:MAG: hypothetical protein NZ898_13630, partial [Myxococcota bacterium]|nr:hypothetical protein [Myxococcota bacterium]